MGYSNLLQQLRQELAQKSGIPSGVASAKETSSVKEALDQTDPERKSQVLPQFANMMQQILQLLGSIGMGQGGGSNSQNPNMAGSPNTSIGDTAITDIAAGLCGALEIEANTRGANSVANTWNAIFGNNVTGNANFNSLMPEYQSILKIAINQYDKDLSNNTPMASIVVPINASIVANSVNSVVPPNVVATIPDFYYQVYHPAEMTPFYGYTQYRSISNPQDVIYTTIDYGTTPTFGYLSNAIIYEIQTSFVDDLDPYFLAANLTFGKFVSIMDSITNHYVDVIDDSLTGTGNQFPSQSNQNQQNQNNQNNNNNAVGQLLPILNQLIQQAQSQHLPESILDQQKVSKCLDNHGQNCQKAAQMKQLAQQAIQPGGIMGSGGGGASMGGG